MCLSIFSGTEFMVKLHTQLQFFVASKVSTDRSWQGIRVYLSGHEVRGYPWCKCWLCVFFSLWNSFLIWIFLMLLSLDTWWRRTQSHGLYSRRESSAWLRSQHTPLSLWAGCWSGLCYSEIFASDWRSIMDLKFSLLQIMLGLASHEPHFSLLREEVRFGGKQQKRSESLTCRLFCFLLCAQVFFMHDALGLHAHFLDCFTGVMLPKKPRFIYCICLWWGSIWILNSKIWK